MPPHCWLNRQRLLRAEGLVAVLPGSEPSRCRPPLPPAAQCPCRFLPVPALSNLVRSMVHEVVGRINGQYGTLTHVPIYHLDR